MLDEIEELSLRLSDEQENRRKLGDRLSHERHQFQRDKEATQEVSLAPSVSGDPRPVTGSCRAGLLGGRGLGSVASTSCSGRALGAAKDEDAEGWHLLPRCLEPGSPALARS